jgi:Fur family zinc uptake transcriptional regulator
MATMDDHKPHSEHLHHVHDLGPQAITKRLDMAKAQCQQQGVRFTALRQQIYELILQADKPVGAYDLITELQQVRSQHQTELSANDKKTQSKNVAPPTIYRSLEFLLEQGLIHQLASINAYIPCCHPRLQHTAAFLICTTCQGVQECSSLPVQEMMTFANSDVGFKVSHSVIELQGVCQSCQ